MEFRDLKRQYEVVKDELNQKVCQTMAEGIFIGGEPVKRLESKLAEYVGVKHCVSCANGTDALQLALMAWGTGTGDAVFVPDFTFFSTAEAVVLCGATPVFVDVEAETFNMDSASLENAVNMVLKERKLNLKAVISVDLFGLPANYKEIREITRKYHMKLLEDAAQGFGGKRNEKRAGSFGDIATTSFFPAKPLGCYGDGGALFTDDDSVTDLLVSMKIHGKGADKYDNIRIGMNSRLDTIQAVVLLEKLRLFEQYELEDVNRVADWYREELEGRITIPAIPEGSYSSWAQYTILLKDGLQRDRIQAELGQQGIPTMIYYKKPLHKQKAFAEIGKSCCCPVTEDICSRVLSLPIHPYMKQEEVKHVAVNLLKHSARFEKG